jgi:hypothetical protein
LRIYCVTGSWVVRLNQCLHLVRDILDFDNNKGKNLYNR